MKELHPCMSRTASAPQTARIEPRASNAAHQMHINNATKGSLSVAKRIRYLRWKCCLQVEQNILFNGVLTAQLHQNNETSLLSASCSSVFTCIDHRYIVQLASYNRWIKNQLHWWWSKFYSLTLDASIIAPSGGFKRRAPTADRIVCFFLWCDTRWCCFLCTFLGAFLVPKMQPKDVNIVFNKIECIFYRLFCVYR